MALQNLDWSYHDVHWATRMDCDLRDWSATRRLVGCTRPDVIVHLACGKNLRRSEGDLAYAWSTMAVPAIHVARAAARCGTRVVMMSSDYVYSGDGDGPIPPGTPADPINRYGRMKAISEGAVMALEDFLIIRGTFKERDHVRFPTAVTDQWCSYVYVDEMAEAVQSEAYGKDIGVRHVKGRDMSAYEFMSSIGDVSPITRADVDYPLPRNLILKPGLFSMA